LGASKAFGDGQLDLWKFSVWAGAIALYNSYLITFFFRSACIFWQQLIYMFGGPLKKNTTKIWGANPSLNMIMSDLDIRI
jgi:hypothetical protein